MGGSAAGAITGPIDRAEIEDGAIAGRGLEICWLKDPFDLIAIQIEGSGRVILEDGTPLRISYDSHNGYSYSSIERVLVERNLIPRKEMSREHVRAWMAAHPEEAAKVLVADLTRQGIADRARDAAGTSEAVILRRILKEFDDETSALAPQIKAANAMYQRASKGETLQTLLDVARVNSGTYQQSGMENAVRTQFRGLARAIAKGDEVGWTPDEISAINQIAMGGTLDNALRFVGKFAPRSAISMTLRPGARAPPPSSRRSTR